MSEFSILTVCTGNICRSPLAELLLVQKLGNTAAISVESAGTRAAVGVAVPPQMQSLSAPLNVDASRHVARQLDASLLREPDLVLAMAREHRRVIVETMPSVMRRVFTLRELARISTELRPQLMETVSLARPHTAADAMRSAVAAAAALRGTVSPPDAAEDFDVVDPYGRTDEVYSQSLEQIIPATDAIADFLQTAAELAD